MTGIALTAASPTIAPPRVERTRFCTRCAGTEAEDAQGAPFGFDRVCGRCGMGVMLSAPRNALSGSGAAIIVVTREGRISAVSEPAEHLVRAASGGREIAEAVLTPVPQAGSRTIRLSARITSCGSPRAALVVLERAPQ
jgi:hypothetical protein